MSVDSKGTNKNATSRWNPLAEGQTLWEPPSSFRTLSTSTQKASWMCQVTIMFLLVNRLSLPSLHPFLHSPLSLNHLSCRGQKAKRGGSEMGPKLSPRAGRCDRVGMNRLRSETTSLASLGAIPFLIPCLSHQQLLMVHLGGPSASHLPSCSFQFPFKTSQKSVSPQRKDFSSRKTTTEPTELPPDFYSRRGARKATLSGMFFRSSANFNSSKQYLADMA